MRTIIDAYYGDAHTASNLPLTDGAITCDRASNIRRTAGLTFAGTDLAPTVADDPLSPYGSHLHIRRMLVYDDDTEEAVELGWYRVDSCQVGDDGTVSVDASDRSAVLADAKFLTPYSVDTTRTVTQVITTLIAEVLPAATVEVHVTRATDRPGPATYDDDRTEAIADLATSIGAECYANAAGNFTLTDIPDLDTTAPVWTVATGPGGVQVSSTRSHSRENVHNAVVIRSDDTSGDTGVWQHVVYDDNPASPTWWNGPFGQVPRFHSSPSIRTVDQAAAAASGLLRETLGVARGLELSLVPNAALEPGDVITVVGDTTEPHLIETLTIPLTSTGAMTATTRARTHRLT